MSDNLRITGHDADWHPKFFAVFVGLFCGLYIIVSAITPKIIDIHGIILPAAIILFPVCCIITDLLTEVYGFNRTRQAIWTALVCVNLYAVFTQIAIVLPPASFWGMQEGFAGIFSTSWRLAIGGSLAWIAGEFINSYVMSKMKIFQNAKGMSLRFIGSTVVGQLADTIVIAIIAFAGTMPWSALFIMIITSWLCKIAYEILALPLSIPITNFVKRLEGVEHFDRQEISIV